MFVGEVMEIRKNWSGGFEKEVSLNLQFGSDGVKDEEDGVSVYWLKEKWREWMEVKKMKVDWEEGRV
ncbi:hypothetical protein, partial [Paenibacillus sp. Y412MC10]|uniref:hypothetical protein n=1 Tax=Geobacillus sp. (strain Y412MC10) TaxID=481743 RepID=UPI001642EC9D